MIGLAISLSLLLLSRLATSALYTLSLHDALPIFMPICWPAPRRSPTRCARAELPPAPLSPSSWTRGGSRSSVCWVFSWRSEEHTSELQSHVNLVCRLLLEQKKIEEDERTRTRETK